ncbi:MAG: hypothetical protein Q8K26_02370, partial [Candidatus Gracilibacteria bacterium]|nr:hypothetical protein [Candidatus Gracilibacteria bacterium]
MKKVPTGDNLRPLEGKSPLSQKSFSQRMEMLLVSTPFVVLMALGAQGCSNEQKKIEKGNASGSNPKVEQIVAGGANQNVTPTAEQGGEQKEEGELKLAPIESGKDLISFMIL